MLAAQRSAVHVHLGYSAFSEYVERMFGYRPRTTLEKLRVAEALEDLPAIGRALSSGELSWSAARELTRIALRETEHEWLAFAHGKTLRQLEQVLAGKQRGDAPGSAPDRSAQRHVLRFDVAAETFALLRDALNELRRRAGAALDDDSALLELARCVLGGPRDAGRASYQVVFNVCPECRTGQQHSQGELVPVDAEVIRMAQCDAQHISPVLERSPLPANDCQPRPGRAQHAGTADLASATEDEAAHVGASPLPKSDPLSRRDARIRRRAHQDIPPALRRAVLLRDQRRCQVPGCRNTTWVDVHHLELRSDGGRHSLENLTCLCSVHHRAAHRGKILLERSESGALRARHADGSEYGGSVKPQTVEIRTKVFSALRRLGFREGEVRAVIDRLRREPTLEAASFDGLLRAALAALRRPIGDATHRWRE